MSTGIQGQLGVKTETTFGTFVAPTIFHDFTSESVALTQEYIKTGGIRSGSLVQRDNLHTQTTRMASGSVSMDALDTGLGIWLNQLHGNTVTPTVIGVTSLYTQTHAIGLTDPDAKSMTLQVGRPSVNGTVNPFSYVGTKVVTATFTLEMGGVVAVEFAVDAQDEATGESLASATYDADALPFTFQGAELEFDDVVLTDCVRSATITVSIPMATERFCIGSSGLKKVPLVNGPIEITGSLEAEFASMTQHTAFRNATRRKLELNCVGQTVDGAETSALNFTIPSTVTVESSPMVEGPDIISQSLSLEATYNGTDAPLTIVYVSTDTAIG